MKRTISASVGKGSFRHNSRVFTAENVDAARSNRNIEYCNDDIKEAYHELFDEALERYNAKQKRKDRMISDYYEKIKSGKQEKLFHELIIQIGNKEDCGSETEEGILAAKILDKYMEGFKKRNPSLRVFSAYLHLDEATPHLHIDFIPFTTGSKRGLDTRVSLKQALASLGFKGGTRGDTEWNQWVTAEKQQLAEIMKEHGIEWEQKGTHEEHLSVLEFKKQKRVEEVAELEEQAQELLTQQEEAKKTLFQQKEQVYFLEREVGLLEEEAAEKRYQAKDVKEELQDYEERYQKLKPMMDKTTEEVLAFEGKIDEILPKAGVAERGATYRDKKARPLFIRMRNKIKGLAAALYKALADLAELREICERLEWDNQKLQSQCVGLEQQLEEASEATKNLERVERFFGKYRVEEAIREILFQEMKEAELEKQQQEKRKQPQGKQSVLANLQRHKKTIEERERNNKTIRKNYHHGIEI